jgi:hypothetical protein
MHELIGTWRLVEWTAQIGDDPPVRPFGGDPVGLLTYTSDRRMWATLMRRRRPALGVRTLAEAPAEGRAQAAAGYVGYAGTFEVDGEAGSHDVVIHHVEVSLFPDWVGGEQRRLVRWIANEAGGHDLELSTPPEATRDGRMVVNRLRWRRIGAG